jgi:hypothetical protein
MTTLLAETTPMIACQQVLAADARVFSVQWLVFPAESASHLTPGYLLTRYLRHIRRLTWTLVRPLETGAGVQLRLLGSRLSLITLAPLRSQADGDGMVLTLDVSGGLLVQPGQWDRGRLSFHCEPVAEGVRVALQLTGYSPLLLGPKPSRWRKLLYRWTQAYLHRLVTVRFLARLYRELVDRTARLAVQQVRLREGEDI